MGGEAFSAFLLERRVRSRRSGSNSSCAAALAAAAPVPERADAERVTTAVAPLPSDKAGAPDPATLQAAKQSVDLLGADGGIKAVPAGGTLLATLGGPDAVAAIVDAALQRATADWRVKRFLPEAGTCNPAARKHMEDWLAAAFGGGQYSGPDPATCAADKGLTASHIDALAAHVTGAMSELGMPLECIEAAAAEIAAARKRAGLP